MLVAHLSDLHIFSAQPETAPVRRDILAAVKRLVADIATLPLRPDAVLITGDIADGGSVQDYELAKALLAPLSMPVLVVPGNHDRRETMRQAFADTMDFEPGPFLNFATSIGEFEIIGIDTVIPGRVEGALCDQRLDWLETKLSAARSLTFLLAHHPPFSSGNAAWDTSALTSGKQRFSDILSNAGAPVRLLCGHVHQAMHGTFAGHYAAIGGSPAFSYDFAIAQAGAPEATRQPYCYFLHHRRVDGTVGVHARYVDLG